MATETFIGFDSAWTDNARAPGAICAVQLGAGAARFHAPRLVRFADALAFVDDVADGYTLIALDQPTIVPNLTSMRPAERVAASAISWMGGGVQPANRNKVGMFCDASPIWTFLTSLGAIDDPIASRDAEFGRYVMEVFPALALAAFDAASFRRLGAAKYNPDRSGRFRLEDWRRVCTVIAVLFEARKLAEPSAWCLDAASNLAPRKADQDRLDAMICLAIALHWRLEPADASIMIGDLHSGYIVAPASSDVRARLMSAAEKIGVEVR